MTPTMVHASPGTDARRVLQLLLAATWLLDGLLQYQSFMYTQAFGQMIGGTAAGNPGVIADPIRWNAALVAHHLVLLNSPPFSCCWGWELPTVPQSGWRWPPRSRGRWACGGSAKASAVC